jgi:hypothetical protein
MDKYTDGHSWSQVVVIEILLVLLCSAVECRIDVSLVIDVLMFIGSSASPSVRSRVSTIRVVERFARHVCTVGRFGTEW